MFVSASATISLNDESLTGYKSRLDKGVRKFIQTQKKSDENGQIWLWTNTNETTVTPIGAIFHSGASIFPKCDSRHLS